LFTIAARQLTWTLLGLVLLVVGAVLPVLTLRRLTHLLLAVSGLGLDAVLGAGIGSVQFGACRRIALPGGQFQPSKVAKLAPVLPARGPGRQAAAYLAGLPVALFVVFAETGLLLGFSCRVTRCCSRPGSPPVGSTGACTPTSPWSASP